MTREDAISTLEKEWQCIDRNDGMHCNRVCDKCELVMDTKVLKDAYNMAIEALKAQDGIVHCKDCKYLSAIRTKEAAKKFGQIYECQHGTMISPSLTDYCSVAKRKGKET